MDVLLAWSSSNGNSLSAFLKYWDGENPKIASPDGIDAVRIMTIHKAKGLEFPYLIYPFAGEEQLFKVTGRWCVPEQKDGASDLISEGIFNVNLSSKSVGTVFAGQYKQEEQLQYVDAINTFYVAMTRAVKVLHTIAVKSSKPDEFKCFADILYAFTRDFGSEHGRMYSFAPMTCQTGQLMPVTFNSWPLRGRMRSTGNGAEYFAASADGDVQVPVRLKGIVLHKILSDVRVPSDIQPAVDAALASGLIDPAQAAAYRDFLQARLAEVASYGWFAPENLGGVLNEVGIIDADGGLHRPDRVVFGADGSVTVIDYKFGSEHPGYAAQVRRYCALFRSLGYAPVKGYLWYVTESKVTPVQ